MVLMTMAPILSTLSTISLFLILFFSPSHSTFLTSIFPSPESICNSTPNPNFCKSTLPQNKPGTVLDFARIAIQHSLSSAQKFLPLIQRYLRLSSTICGTALRALEDCRLLAEWNIDFLSNTLETINPSNTLHELDFEDVQTLLSAILTNQQTCLDGLLEGKTSSANIKNALLGPITQGLKLHSTCLALFTHGWVHDTSRGRGLTERERVYRELHESLGGRRLLQMRVSDVNVSQVVVVNPDGTGNFTTISDAVFAAPNNTKSDEGYFVIYVVAGVYEEYVSIAKTKKYLMIIGDGIDCTVITGNRSVVDGWTTFNSATFAVSGQGFVAANITFRNTAGPTKHQAVAVRNSADMSTFYRCSFEGYQDTLYAHSHRQFYRDCDIYGTVDFIFGNAAAVLQNCNIYARLPLSNQFNAITAQGRTDPNQNTGISIHGCAIMGAEDLGDTKTYLGRPWKEYSRTVFMQSFMDGLIDPAGWIEWSGDFALCKLYYVEYDNYGTGSNTTNRVEWSGYHPDINETDASTFTVSSFISGIAWLDPTGVPYFDGLI